MEGCTLENSYRNESRKLVKATGMKKTDPLPPKVNRAAFFKPKPETIIMV